MKRQNLLTLLIAVVALFSFSTSQAARPKARHVVLIGLDGWGAYSLPKADMPNVKQLMADGAYSLKKRSVLPSSSAINWASMFMGAGTEIHGYTAWNSRRPEIPERFDYKNNIFPTIFQVMRDARPEAEMGCLYEWDGIKYLVDTLSLSYHYGVADYEKTPDDLAEKAVAYIKEKRPTLVAVCFDNPDHVGHNIGHDTPEYYAKLKEVDAYIGRVVQAVKDAGMADETIFILTSDHGGINKGHGGKTLRELETPFIISGKGVKRGVDFDDVSTMQQDVAATIAYIFNLKQPQVWTGRPVTTVFK